MAKIIPIREQFQHFVEDVKESFWGDLYGRAKLRRSSLSKQNRCGSATALKCERATSAAQTAAALPQRLLPAGFQDTFWLPAVEGGAHPGEVVFFPRYWTVSAPCGGSRVAGPGGIFARTEHPAGGAGGVFLTGDLVSAQTVSRLSRSLDRGGPVSSGEAERRRGLSFLDGSTCGCGGRRAASGCVCWWLAGSRSGARQLLAFLRSQAESQADWEGLLGDLYRRGLVGENSA